MNKELLTYCENEIQDLVDKNLIRKSKFPWSCSTFYVFFFKKKKTTTNKQTTELEKGTPRFLINYKSFNDSLRWIRYPIPNKKDLF